MKNALVNYFTKLPNFSYILKLIQLTKPTKIYPRHDTTSFLVARKVIANYAPLEMAATPVRAISLKPKGCMRSAKASILSGVPMS